MNTEKFNDLVRAFVTLTMTGVFCYLSVIGKIGAEVFAPMVTMVLMWWFKSRDDQTKSKEIIEQIKEAKTGTGASV